MKPVKVPLLRAIPPPEGYDIPPALASDLGTVDMTGALEEFKERVEEGYYAEWFWFPYQSDVWVNTWKRPLYFLSFGDGEIIY